jgi:hypothetical protein
MEGRRFDALTRALASGRSRRQLLKVALGMGGVSLGAAAVASTGDRETEAARRPTPTPRPPVCPGRQVPINGVCSCPLGNTKCGAECCPDGKAECCDGACCYGSCYGEELCCPTGHVMCEGQCVAECCTSEDCPERSSCDSETHLCVCDPDCFGRTCGDDGCGGSCGSCGQNEDCVECNCQCIPQCEGRECGDDSCGGSCGDCEQGLVCSGGQCIDCVPVCTEPNGADGCGGVCPGCDDSSGTHCESDERCHCIQLENGAFVWGQDVIDDFSCERLGCPSDVETGRKYKCIDNYMCLLTCDCG